MADGQQAAGISFSRKAANQASCHSTLQAIKSSSLSVRAFQEEGDSLLCDVEYSLPLHSTPSHSQHANSPTYTWTWWVLFLALQAVKCTC